MKRKSQSEDKRKVTARPSPLDPLIEKARTEARKRVKDSVWALSLLFKDVVPMTAAETIKHEMAVEAAETVLVAAITNKWVCNLSLFGKPKPNNQ